MLGGGGSGDVSTSSNSVELVSGRVLHSSHLLNPVEVEAERFVIKYQELILFIACIRLLRVFSFLSFMRWWS